MIALPQPEGSGDRLAPLDLIERVEACRVTANEKLDAARRSEWGQYMTPATVAQFMAGLFNTYSQRNVSLLDAGAGVGSLTGAFMADLSRRQAGPVHVSVNAYEIDPIMVEHLASTLSDCRQSGAGRGMGFDSHIVSQDFIADSVRRLNGGFAGYTHCIMNPPYKKIRSDSSHARLLRQAGIQTSNLYSAFLALAIKQLAEGGELVAIVPRSFCNGPYFKSFRTLLLSEMAIRHLHIFTARDAVFKGDDVLQETVIFHAIKRAKPGAIAITSSDGKSFAHMEKRIVDYQQVVKAGCPNRSIFIPASASDQAILERMQAFSHSLDDLGIHVSTGPVIDFRLRADLRQTLEPGAWPLIYPAHIKEHFIGWPNLEGKKPNAIVETDGSRRWLMPNGWYTVTRRLSAKEERRRIVAAVHDPKRVPGDRIGFENHLNVFHRNRGGLDPVVARGLAVYLNSTLVDRYLRLFNGLTQVNATDLRLLPYPSLEALSRLGNRVGKTFPHQAIIDGWVDVVDAEANIAE